MTYAAVREKLGESNLPGRMIDLSIKLDHFPKIPLTDIEEVGLRQKTPLLFVYVSVPMESTIIKSKKHGEIIIWDQYYENINRLKFTIEKIADKVKRGDLNFDELTNLKPMPKVATLKF